MQNKSAESALVMQFAKWPEAGRVKTRLMPELGEQGALEAHITLSLAVLNQVSTSGCEVRFFWDRDMACAPEAAAPILARIEALGIKQSVQRGNVLGERMESALAEGLAERDKALIVGSDCPSVDGGYIRQALQALEEVDVVLGPSDDGGYVLIGARTHVAGMLADVSWSTDQALADTLLALERKGLTCSQLSPRWDVDEPGDWRRFTRQFPDYNRSR
jgi:rSAM/selenodomain-associated transferase 1